MTETIAGLVRAHQSGAIPIVDTVRRSFARAHEASDPAIFISLRDEAAVIEEARRLEAQGGAGLALYGIPVAVKDNIDAAGLPTTAACPAFSYTPNADAACVARLKRAGAIIIGKTNLDQFATGLVGTRSPYGTPRNPFRADLIPGGSSSGSAVAVARGIVPLALGTDTAGSGRVPAGLNNIVGLKPSLGLVSTSGVVPACRSLDCVSILALTAEDACLALSAIAGFDGKNPFSRDLPLGSMTFVPAGLRIGVPSPKSRVFDGDRDAETAFQAAEKIAAELGATLVEIDLSPFFETARLLYEGPWIAERAAAVGEFIARHPNDVHPVTRAIIGQGSGPSAVDAFRGMYRLAELKAEGRARLAGIDALMVPTMPLAPTVAQVEADPVGVNMWLGTYTNFVNLMDLGGVAVPAVIADEGTPYGVTFLAPAGRDAELGSLGAAFHARTGLKLGALDAALPAFEPRPTPANAEIAVAVVGAHLSGMPLNHELRSLGARLVEATRTAPDYRLFVLSTAPPRPGMLRVPAGTGSPIELEVWSMRPEAFGTLVAAVAAPLSIGTVRLADGRTVKGFLVEAEGAAGARDISSLGGWRKYLASGH